jgi:Helix-turn-helix domain of resolvase
MRTREGMAVARAKGKLRGKQPKLSARQQRELVRMTGTGEFAVADLAEVFTVSRATVYRTSSGPRSRTRRGNKSGPLPCTGRERRESPPSAPGAFTSEHYTLARKQPDSFRC